MELPAAPLLRRLFATARPRGRDAAAPAPPRAADEPPAGPERVFGCGWFDSSHELRQGLVVHEGMIVTDAAYGPAAAPP